MIHVETLTTESEFEQFSQLYQHKSQGIPADPTFLRQGTTRVAFDDARPGQWLAGYVINDQPIYRYLTVHSEAKKETLLRQHDIAETDIVEIGAIWMDIRALGQNGRWEVYQHMMGDAYATHRSVILGGTVHARIRDTQMQVTKYPFFEGEVTFGNKTMYIWQYYAKRSELWSDFFRATLKEFGGIKRDNTGSDNSLKKAA